MGNAQEFSRSVKSTAELVHRSIRRAIVLTHFSQAGRASCRFHDSLRATHDSLRFLLPFGRNWIARDRAIGDA